MDGTKIKLEFVISVIKPVSIVKDLGILIVWLVLTVTSLIVFGAFLVIKIPVKPVNILTISVLHAIKEKFYKEINV